MVEHIKGLFFSHVIGASRSLVLEKGFPNLPLSALALNDTGLWLQSIGKNELADGPEKCGFIEYPLSGEHSTLFESVVGSSPAGYKPNSSAWPAGLSPSEPTTVPAPNLTSCTTLHWICHHTPRKWVSVHLGQKCLSHTIFFWYLI